MRSDSTPCPARYPSWTPEARRAYREANSERIAAYRREYQRRRKDYFKSKNDERRSAVVAWYRQLLEDNFCALCGEGDPSCLQFHHIDPSTKRANVSALVNRCSAGAAEREINKCVLLCANCHYKVHGGSASLPDVMPELRGQTKCPGRRVKR